VALAGAGRDGGHCYYCLLTPNLIEDTGLTSQIVGVLTRHIFYPSNPGVRREKLGGFGLLLFLSQVSYRGGVLG